LFCIKFPKLFQGKKGVDLDITPDLDITLYPRQDAVWPGTLDKVDNAKSLSDALCLNQTDESLMKFTLDSNHTLPSPMPKLNKNIPSEDGTLPSCDDFDTHKSEDQQKYLQYLIESDHIISNLADQLITILQQAVTVRVFNQPLLKYHQLDVPHSQKRHSTISMDEAIEQKHVEDKPSTDFSVSDIKYAKPDDTRTTSSYMDSRSAQYLTSSTPSRGHSLTCSTQISGNTSESSKCDTSDHSDKSSANVAILFSGGIDSSVLAALVDRYGSRFN